MAERTKEEVRKKVISWVPEEMLQHLKAARGEMRESVEAMLPPEFVAHRREARRETLLAVRSLIDHILKRLEESEKA